MSNYDTEFEIFMKKKIRNFTIRYTKIDNRDALPLQRKKFLNAN